MQRLVRFLTVPYRMALDLLNGDAVMERHEQALAARWAAGPGARPTSVDADGLLYASRDGRLRPAQPLSLHRQTAASG